MKNDRIKDNFVWNVQKEKLNILNHSLSFEEAIQAFTDKRRHIVVDELHSHNEDRMFCIGLVNGKIATVRFTYRGQKIRIIGAGFWRKGKKLYEEKNKI